MFILYSSEGCHLCEEALALCLQYIKPENLNIIDIVDDDDLVEQYGVHIPVLKKLSQDSSQNIKLFWPFTQAQIKQLNL